MLERLQSIRPRLQELARLDPHFQLFGAGTHRYQLAPPLAPDKVATFELLHGVRLPEDYRAFLLQVGSSGAGPYYGLKALGNFQHLNGLDVGFLSTPFPHRTAFNLFNSATYQALFEEEKAVYLKRVEEFEKDEWVYGTLCLSHEGCGMSDLLVVSGEEKGCVWVDDRCNDQGLSPIKPDHKWMFVRTESARTSFLDWYEWWLDWSFTDAKSR